MTTSRRAPDETAHDFQHRLISERLAAWETSPRRTGVDKIVRREAAKRAWWTLTGYMRGMHQVRGQAPFLMKTWDEVTAWHARLHAR